MIIAAVRRGIYRVYRALPPPIRRVAVRWLTPNYTVGAVVVVIAAEQLLLVRKAHESAWSLPGGLVGRGESAERAAERELAEETGIRAAPHALQPAQPNVLIYPDRLQVDAIFRLQLVKPRSVVLDAAELVAGEWHHLAGLPTLTPMTTQLLQKVGALPGEAPS